MLDSDLPSPSFVVDLDRVRSNTERMRGEGGKNNLRPHVKTHKTLEGCKQQVGNETIEGKIVCSTLKEAEFFSNEYADILYGVILEPSKYIRAWQLHLKLPSFSILLDSLEGVESFASFISTQLSKFSIIDQSSDVFMQAARRVSVFLAVDATGYKREGFSLDNNLDREIDIDEKHPIISTALAIKNSRRLRLGGIYSHSGNSYNSCVDLACSLSTAAAVSSISSHKDAKMNALVIAERERDLMVLLSEKLQSFGVTIPIISIGATPSISALVESMSLKSSTILPQIEYHPGNYIFYDRQQVESGSCSLDDIACYVVARVLARYPDRNEFLIDAGGCALHKDLAGLHDGTYGCLVDNPSLVIKKLTQEVAVIGTLGGEQIDLTAYPPGKVVRIYPNHSCMTAACHEVYHVVEGVKDSNGSRNVINMWKPCKFW